MKKVWTILTVVAFMMVVSASAWADNTASVNDVSANVISGQDQNQGQSQQNALDVSNIGNITDSFNSKALRGYPITGEVKYGAVVPYYGQHNISGDFQDIKTILLYTNFFTEGALKRIVKDAERCRVEFKRVNNTVPPAPPAKEDGKTRWIKIYFSERPYQGATLKGFVTAKATKEHTTTLEVVARAALEAINNGCNVLHVMSQGFAREARATGWGIGFNTTQAQMSDSQDSANVSSGGTGYSSARAWLANRPWVQCYGLIDYNIKYPKLHKPWQPEKEAK